MLVTPYDLTFSVGNVGERSPAVRKRQPPPHQTLVQIPRPPGKGAGWLVSDPVCDRLRRQRFHDPMPDPEVERLIPQCETEVILNCAAIVIEWIDFSDFAGALDRSAGGRPHFAAHGGRRGIEL